jgi:hypothetical protein
MLRLSEHHFISVAVHYEVSAPKLHVVVLELARIFTRVGGKHGLW